MGQPFWSVPYPRNAFFTGRDEIVVELRARFTPGGTAAVSQAISGLGGMGKTQTAVEYAYRYRNEYQAVLWLDAASLLALKDGCGELARRLDLPHPESDLDQAVLAVKLWLAARPGWLLILDNADDPDVLRPFLPPGEHGHILVTSRAQDFQDLGIFSPVTLEQWPVPAAAEFLLKRCGRVGADGGERDAVAELARRLDGLPLALEQAAAYIAAGNGLTFRRYLESYRSGGLKRLEARRPALGKYPRSVVSTWAANFDAVQKELPAAADVLRLSAFLAPEAIPFELLTRGASELGPELRAALGQADDGPLAVNDLLSRLARFSLIRIDGQDETYSINRMVQEVLRAAMDEPTRRPWAERAVRAVKQAFPAVEFANWPLCGRLLSHALAIASWIERDGMQFQEAASILHETSYYLDYRGQYAEAEPLYLRAIEIRRVVLGEGHPLYAESLNNLAALYQAMGRHDQAEPLFRRAVEIYRTTAGEGHPDYATALNNLAELYRGAGRHGEAEPLFRRAMEIRCTALGENHPDYASSLNNLALLYDEMGRHDKAERLYLRAMEIRRTALGEQHPYYAGSLNNLAALYQAMGRSGEAEPLYLRAIETYARALGEGHPSYATSLSNLAGIYESTGRPGEAERHYVRAMEIRRTALGEGHPDYAASLRKLARLYASTGRHAEAEPLFGQAIRVLGATLGTSHPSYRSTVDQYLRSQREGGLAVPDGELPAEGLGDPPVPSTAAPTAEGEVNSAPGA